MSKEVQPALIVIFGVTGDLSRRKLLPALYHLMRDNLLHPETQIIGVTRQKLTKNEVLAPLEKYTASHARPSPAALRRFKRAFHLFAADLSEEKGYRSLKKFLDKEERAARLSYQRVYYLSVPPAVIDEIVGFMGTAGLASAYKRGLLPRLLIEKPFGYDKRSARTIIKSIRRHFDESQVYRIDHYLAKEMAQNILHFRFGNPLFASVWNRDHITQVEVTAYEQIGIEGRTRFYEQTGALRDLVQSHLLFLTSLVAMEQPRRLTSPAVHAARLRLLKDIKTPEPYEVRDIARRGQYKTYRSEIGNRHSTTETFASVQLQIVNNRWRDIPFVLSTGKALSHKLTAVRVHFISNILEMRLQPDEAIELSVHIKEPGHVRNSAASMMDFSYQRRFASRPTPEAYENVLLDAIHGDQLLFASSKEVLEAWRIVQPLLDEWQKSGDTLKIYPNNPAKLPQSLKLV